MPSRRFVSAVLLCALAVTLGAAIEQGSVRAWRSSGKAEQQLIKMNEDLVSAEVRRDLNALNEAFAADYVHVHTNGWVESRADFLKDFETGKRVYHSVDLENVQVKVYSENAFIIGNAHVRSSSGGEKDNVNRFLAVWVRERGKWRLALWMTTRLEDARTPWEGTAGDDHVKSSN